MLLRATRWTLLLAIVLFTGVIAWLAAHPGSTSPWLSRLASRHLLAGQGTVRFASYSGGLLHGVTLHDVTLTLPGENGGVTVVGVDTLSLSYALSDLMRRPYELRRVTLVGPEVRLVRGEPVGEAPADRSTRGEQLLVHDLRVRDGALTLADADGRLQEEVADIFWRGSLRLGDEARLAASEAALTWVTRDARLADLRGAAALRDGVLTIDQLSGLVNESSVLLSGGRGADGALDLKVEARRVDVREVENLIDMTLGFQAHGDVRMDLHARGDTLDFDVDFDGELEGYEFREFTGRATLTPRFLEFRSLSGRLNGALVSGRGRFDVTDTDDVIFRVTGSVADVDLARDLVPGVELPATDGWGEVEIWRREAAEATLVRGWLRDGYVADVPFDSLHVLVSGDADGVTFHSLDLLYGAAKARLDGRADLDGNFRGRLDVLSTDLARLPPVWPAPPLHGRLRASGEVRGADPVYDFAGNVLLVDAGLEHLDAAETRLEITVADALGDPAVWLEAEGDGLRAAGVPLGRFELAGKADAARAELDRFRTVRGDTALAFHAAADFRDGTAVIRVPELTLDLEGAAWAVADTVQLEAGPGVFRLRPAELASGQGRLAAEIDWDRPAASLSGSVDVATLDLELINPFLDDPVLNGRVSARCGLGGSPDEPLVTLTARLVDGEFPLARLDTVTVDLDFSHGILDLHRLELASDHGRLRAAGAVSHPRVPPAEWWRGAALDLHLDVLDGDWAFIDQFGIPSLDRIAGRFRGSVELGGTTLAPRIEGGLTSEPFHVHWLHLDRLEGGVAYEPGQLTLSDLRGHKADLHLSGRIEVPLQLDLHSEPVSPLDGPLYMSLTIPEGTDLAPLAEATNAFVSAGGTGGLDLVVSGRADHPYYSGSVRVRDGSMVIRRLNEVYSDISADGTWQGDVLTLRDIRGREGMRGTLAGEGTLTFRGLELETFEVDLAADRFLVASIPDVRALVRSDSLRLTGVKVGPDSLIVPRFTGDLEVIQARYTGDFSEQAGVVDPRVGTVAPDWLADLDITAPPRTVSVQNQQMELDLGGDVRLTRDEGGLDVRGQLVIDQGHLPVFNNDFRVTAGTATFQSGRGPVPDLDISAETQVRLPAVDGGEGGNRRLERVWISLRGPATGPTVTFESESGYPRQSIERMLLGMSPHASDSPTVNELRRGTVAAGFNLLEREVAQQLNVVDTFDIIGGRERADGTMQTLVGVGKYIGRDLYVRFAQAITDQDREVLVEYQISDHLLLQSEINRRLDEALGNTTYSVDLKYRFEY